MSAEQVQGNAVSDSLDSRKAASADLRNSSVQSKPVHVEIRPRDTYQHHVAAEAGDLISWSFFTRRKNIAFGLFYLHTHSGGRDASVASLNRTASGNESNGAGRTSPTASPHKQRLRTSRSNEGLASGETEDTAIREAVVATRGSVYIQPPASPKPGHGSTSLQSSRTGSIQLGSMEEFTAGSASSLLRVNALTSSMDGLARSRTMDSRSSVATSGLSIVSGHRASAATLGVSHANASLPDLRATTAGTSISAPNAVEYIEILPVERYESFEATIAGHYEVPVKGTYVLYFDNSYSINTSKELFLTASVGPSIPPTMEVLSGWLLKKKQRRLQGWARRWFQLDRKGILSYFADRFSPCRGSVDLNQCTITKIPQKLMITIDSGSATYHLRATTVEDYSRWSEQFTFVRSQGALLMLDGVIGGCPSPGTTEGVSIGATVASATGDFTGPVAPVGSILKHTERIHQHMQKSEGSLADLRALAAKEDSGLIKYLAFLERTFQSLQELYDALADYAVFLQRTGRRMSQVSANRALLGDPVQQQQLLASLQGVPAANLQAQQPSPPQGSSLISPLIDPSLLSMDEFYDAEEVVLTEISEESDILDSVHGLGSASIVDSPTMVPAPEFSDALELIEPPAYFKSMEAIATPVFRLRMPHVAPPCSVSLSSILRRSIGKDWSTISMPVALNEPLSALQRLCEELEYSELLDEAAQSSDPLERMARVVAFAVSAYASSVHRAERKPFNPLLGETFEYERPDRGYRFLAEKVSHRPLIVACHAESTRGWCWWQDQRMKSKFWGKSMEYIPLGVVHVYFADTGDHFVWSKVITCVRNLLSGNKWVENYGEMVVKNERTGDVAKVTFKSNSSGFFGSSNNTGANEVTASITSPSSGSREPVIALRGRWDSLLMRENANDQPAQLLWRAASVPNDHMEYYGLGHFAITLNDLPAWLREKLPPTDSRLRPDQRQLEEGQLEEAEATKQLLEQRQREWRARMEEAGESWMPRWFHHTPVKGDPEGAWIFRRGSHDDYWQCREQGKWPSMPSLW